MTMHDLPCLNAIVLKGYKGAYISNTSSSNKNTILSNQICQILRIFVYAGRGADTIRLRGISAEQGHCSAAVALRRDHDGPADHTEESGRAALPPNHKAGFQFILCRLTWKLSLFVT